VERQETVGSLRLRAHRFRVVSIALGGLSLRCDASAGPDWHARAESVTLPVMPPPAELMRARPDLDRWLGAPAVRTSHRRESRAGAHALWLAAAGVRLRDCRLLGRLVAVRVSGTEPEMTFDTLFRAPPFVLLEEGPTWLLSGLCGRIWTVRGELARLSGPQAFLDWQEPATVRVLFAHWAEPLGDGAMLHSEVRVAPVDRRAALYLRALEPFIAAFQGLVGLESLSLAVRRADQR
jgi:hypothetical protein